MTDPVQAALAQAAAQASQLPTQSAPGVTSLPATQSTAGGAVAPLTPGKAFSMETIGAGQMSVDAWLKVKEGGLLIGDNAEMFTSAKVVIEMVDGIGFVVKQGIKGGNPAVYAYTFDGAVANDGKSWADACARIRSLPGAQGAAPYPCVDLPFETIEPISGFKVGNPQPVQLIEAGKRLGYTTSTTNWANWVLFYKAVEAAGLMGQKVEVELGVQGRKNAKGNTWGVVTFKLLGIHADAE